MRRNEIVSSVEVSNRQVITNSKIYAPGLFAGQPMLSDSHFSIQERSISFRTPSFHDILDCIDAKWVS